MGAQSSSRLREDTQSWGRWVQAPIEGSWRNTADSHSWGSWVRLNVVQRTRRLTMVAMDMTNRVNSGEKVPEEVTV